MREQPQSSGFSAPAPELTPQQRQAIAKAKARLRLQQGGQPAPVQQQAPAPRLSTPEELSPWAAAPLPNLAQPQAGGFIDAGAPSVSDMARRNERVPAPRERTVAEATSALTPAGQGFEMVPSSPEARPVPPGGGVGSMTESLLGPPGYEKPPEGMKYVLTKKSPDGSADEYELAPLSRGDEGTFDGVLRDLNNTRKTGLQHYARAGLGLVEGIGNLPGDAADWMASFSGGGKWRDPSPRVDLSGLKPEIPADLQSVSGALAEGFVQFLGARGLMGGSKSILGETARSAVATGVGFAGDSGRAADMIPLDKLPAGTVRDFVGWLQTNPDDSGMLGRVKNFSEDAIANLLLMGLGEGVKQGAKLGSKAVGQVLAPRPRPSPAPVGAPANASPQPSVAPVAQAPIPQAPGRGGQAGASGAGQGGGAPPVLNATPQPAGPANVALAKSDAQIIGRLLRAGGVARNDVDNTLTGLVQAYQSSNNPRMTLAFFAEEYLPTVLDKQVADDVIQKLRGFGRERFSANGPRDTSRTTMRDTIDTLRTSQQDNLTGVMEDNLYKGDLIGQEDKLNAQLEQNARVAYSTALENGNARLLNGTATPDEMAAAASIGDLLKNEAFVREVPKHLKIKAMREGVDIEALIQRDPISAAHWLQSELRQAVSAAEGVGGAATSESRLYGEMRTALLDKLEKAVPGYQGARLEHGDIYGAKEAMDFGNSFFKAARSEVETARLARDFKAMSKRQQTAATMSIRDALKNEFRNKAEETAAKVTRLQQAGVLDALETVLGADGRRVADAIRSTVKENDRLRAIDMLSGSNTADNLKQMEAAADAVRSPINKVVGSFDDKRSFGSTLMADAALMAFHMPPVATAGKIASGVVGKLGKPSPRKLSSATKTLYGLPAPKANALAAPPAPRAPRQSKPKPPAPTQETLDDLLRQYDAIDHRNNPQGSQRLLARITKLKQKLAASPPAKTGGKGPPGTTSQSPAAVASALVSGGTAYAATDGDPTATLVAAAGGGLLGNKLAKMGAPKPKRPPAPRVAAPVQKASVNVEQFDTATPLYHGTVYDGDPFGPFTHVGTKRAAKDRLGAIGSPGKGRTRSMHEVYLKKGQMLDIKADTGAQHSPSMYLDALSRTKVLSSEEIDYMLEPIKLAKANRVPGEELNFEGYDPYEVAMKRAAEKLDAHGIVALRYKNSVEDPGSYSYIVPNPKNLLKSSDAKPAPKPPAKMGMGGSDLPMDEASRMQRAREMGFDVDTPLYHGTTHSFDEFSGAGGNIENHHGSAAYFSTSPDDVARNYANPRGADLTNRIESTAERISNDIEDAVNANDFDTLASFGITEAKLNGPGIDFMEEARRVARERIAGKSEGATIPTFARLRNPVVVNGGQDKIAYSYMGRQHGAKEPPNAKATRWDFETVWDDAGEEIISEGGPAADLVAAAERHLADIGADSDKIVAKLWDEISNNEGIDADAFERIVRSADDIIDNDSSPGQIIQQVYRDMGHDGIILRDADRQFSNMGMRPGTHHYVVFDPKNIRGKFAKFDPSQSGSSKLLAGIGKNQGAAMAGTGVAGAAFAPDQNGDGTVDATERASGFLGGALTAGVVTGAARALKGGKRPPVGHGPAQATFAPKPPKPMPKPGGKSPPSSSGVGRAVGGGVAGAMAGGLAGEAGGQDDLTGKISQSEQTIAAANKALADFDKADAFEKQRIVKGAGLYAGKIDGDIAGKTTEGIEKWKAQKAAEIAKAERELTELIRRDAYQKNHPNALVEGAREYGPAAAGILALLGLKFMRGSAAKKAVIDAEVASNKLNRLITKAPVTGMTNKAGVDRPANLNTLWQKGGASKSELPFKQDGNGKWKPNPKAKPVDELFADNGLWQTVTKYVKGKDLAWILGGSLDAAVAQPFIDKANRDLADAEADWKANPSNETFKRVEDAKNAVMAYTLAQRIGLGIAGGRILGSIGAGYAKPRPNIPQAATEQAALKQFIAGSKPPPKPRTPRGPPSIPPPTTQLLLPFKGNDKKP